MRNLIIFSHPHLATSQTHRTLLDEIAELPQVKIHHLESMYPDGQIDVLAEQQACQKAERIIWQFPLYWHACPAMLKRWQDEVFELDWAYGAKQALAGKNLLLVVSTASIGALYDGATDISSEALWYPMRLTAEALGLHWQTPLVLHDVEHLPRSPFDKVHQTAIEVFAQQYRALLS
ncbi:NAD(P)H-dependent oxidoreductase [Chitinibacter sp. GC72]|uniref:NAD(P)H-dependent oxidoreductase n=1 Tax=Chitinibacter sp. GC72 TaxID=1526917 RepID=UPI0012F962CA|nr:NAD(P)H-dependent oxidoreductase [Chitinibacter sp. GC72]